MMTNKAYLSQLTALERRITYHRERLGRLRRELDAIPSPWGEHYSGPVNPDAPYVRLIERIEILAQELAEEERLYDRLRLQIEETVSRLPDQRMSLVLLYRFVENKTFLQIGDLLYMNKGTAKRWEDRALACLELPEDPVCIFSGNSATAATGAC